MSGEKRRIAACAQLSLRMVVLWNRVLMYILGKMPAGMLAGELEECLYHYKAYWRENSREGDLARVSDVFFWYADLLRDTLAKLSHTPFFLVHDCRFYPLRDTRFII